MTIVLESPTRRSIDVSLLRTDGGTQTRERIDPDAVDGYAADMRRGAEFPPVVAFYDGETYWLADGFHRVAAAKKCRIPKIAVDVRPGDKRAAILFSVGANASHGLRRTNGDKRRAVLVLLGDAEWAQRSDRWIAEKCGVSNTFVASLRAQVSTVDTSQVRMGKDGKQQPARKPAPGVQEASVDGWGSFEVSAHVVKIVQVTRDFADRLDALFREVDPRFEDEVARRAEDSILGAFERMAAHLPVDARRAERNRARFQVLTGGK
jgi:hypothetical protein